MMRFPDDRPTQVGALLPGIDALERTRFLELATSLKEGLSP